MPIANFFKTPQLLWLRQRTSEQGYCAARRRPRLEPGSKGEREQRLWKLCMETDSSHFGIIEWVAFLFFGVLAFAATLSSISELFHLLVSGSVEHTVRALLTR